MLLESAHAVDDQAVAILRKAALNIEGITSVQFSLVTKTTDHPDSPQEKSFEDSMIFTYANGKQRSEIQLTDRTTGERLHEVSIFDGSRHQMFHEHAGQLVLSNSPMAPNISLLFNPLELPYMFLSRNNPVSFAELRDSTTWNEMFEQSTYVGTEFVNDIQCEKITFPMLTSPNHEATWLVFFATRLNHFPIKSVLTSTGMAGANVIEVRAHSTLTSGDVSSVVPTEISLVEYSDDSRSIEAQRTELFVDPSSIKLNSEFDDDLFTIPVSKTQWVHDVDAGTSLHVGGETASIAQDSQRRWRAVLAFCLLVAVVAGVVAWKRWKR
ncbi:MAG: hypothetical protein O3C40_35740 [Planctomycetota bacterium]|nr:hypothetical protein [Planctomycetota bacterium]